MKTAKLIQLCIATALLVSGIVQVAYGIYFIKANINLPIYAKAQKTHGFNVDADALWMGGTSQGNSLTRIIKVRNPHDYPITITWRAAGNIKEWLLLPDPTRLEPNETTKVYVSVRIPDDVMGEERSGNLHGVVRRVL